MKKYLEKPKKKKFSVRKTINKLDDLARIAVRLRENMVCEKCGRKCTNRDAQSSHVLPKSTHPMLRFELLNIQLLCYHCHMFWWHKDIIAAYEWFKKKFPVSYKQLIKMDEATRGGRFGQQDYEDIEIKLRGKIKDYERELK